MNIATREVTPVIQKVANDVSYQLPVPSPKGNLLACVKYISGVSSLISVVNLNSGEEEEIWNSGGRYKFIQSISWSPNGEIFIAFTAEDFKGRSKLCLVNLLTKQVVEFDLSFDVIHACWATSRH
jgi:Tol biopolymer transport system component